MTAAVAIDARREGELDALTIVAGLPLLCRLLRGLARAKHADATVYVRDRDHRAQIARALADYPVKGGLAVAIEFVDPGAAPPPNALLGWALYDRSTLGDAGKAPLEPILELKEASDARAAVRLLFASIRKSIALDGIVCYYTHRPIARVITRAILNTKISANQVTFMALLAGLFAAICAARGDHLGLILAGAGYFASTIIDNVDGDLARLRLEASRLGEWLDAMTDELNTFMLLIGLGIGLQRAGAESIWLPLCVGAALVGALSQGRQYLELHRLGKTIDTAQFPWFFRDESDTTEIKATSTLGWVLVGFGFLIRRDVHITGISVLLACGLAKIAAALVAGGLLLVAGLTAIHFAIVGVRRRSGT